MPFQKSGYSHALQTYIDKGLLSRLPVTFSTFFFDSIKDWNALFPAEQSYYERLLGLLDRSDPKAGDALFEPMRVAEVRMGVDPKQWAGGFTLEHVDFLNRSAHYSEWRQAVRNVFANLDPLLDAEVERQGRPRLVVVLSPSDLPVGPDRMWLRIAKRGKRIPLSVPDELGDYVSLLLTGSPREKRAPSLPQLYAASRRETRYEAWSIEAGETLAPLSQDGVVTVSYAALEKYRARLMSEVSQVVDKEKIRGPRELGARLKQLKIGASEGGAASDPVLGEFTRAVLLSGNGTLLVNNTFVEWATVQAVRRARPSVTTVAFGIRNKVKPFSSLLIYTDQEKANPIPTQMDTLGSYVDLEIFYEYILQEYEKYAEYRRNTVYLFVGEGLDELLAIAPPDFPLMQANEPVPLDRVFQQARTWLNV